MSLFFILFFILTACSSEQPPEEMRNGEFIYRHHDEYLFIPPNPEKMEATPFSWEKDTVANLPRITKEFFRCKGSSLNQERLIDRRGRTDHIVDCGGSEKHSLPLRDNKEFIYPIFLELANYVQAVTKKKVVITSGHRCPVHNEYVDSSPSNQSSKHMIGAEMSFYVQGMEHNSEEIVKILIDFYSKYPEKEFREFQRFEKGTTNVSTPPVYNKEIFVKLFRSYEGRNFDNRHPYPYISIQLRYDRDLNEQVVYSWDQANKNYLRR